MYKTFTILTLRRFALAVCTVVASSSLNATDIDGYTEPYRDIDISAGEMGTIAEVLVREGDRVRVGQLVARLDEEPLRAALKAAESEMRSVGKLRASQADARMQSEMWKRLDELRSRNHASANELFRAEVQKEISESQLLAIEEEIRVKTMEFQRIEAQLDSRRMYSPIDGIVTRVFKDVSEFTSPSDPGIVKVVQLDPLLIVFSVPGNLARQIHTSESVNLSIEGQTAVGVVEFVSPTIDAQSGTTRVRVRVANPEEKLPCGASCILRLGGDVPAQLTMAK